MLCILFLVRQLPAYFYRSILFRAFTGLLPDIPTGRDTSVAVILLWLSWCCSFLVLFVNLDSLSSFYYLGYCRRSHSYVSFLLLIFCLACYNVCTYYFLFHLCAGSQVLVGRPLKCLSLFGFDLWKLLTEKYCLLNCMAVLSTIRSTWTMCTIRSRRTGYTF